MTKRLFRGSGPHNVKSLGNDQYQMSITIPTDGDGRIARECPNSLCSPAYFKVTPGTGITGGQDVAYCPYCKHEANPNDFTTQEQIRYAKDIALREAQVGIDDMIKNALGLGHSGKKKMGGGLISIFEAAVKALVRRALAERGDDPTSIDSQMKKIGNSFQSTDRSKEQLLRLFGYLPSQPDLWERLNRCFEKRHPVTHNIGIVDKKYLERTQQAEREGREVHISEDEAAILLEDIYSAISDIHHTLPSAEA